jgi:hypothetical protein
LRGARRRANSGAVILARSLLITALFYLPTLGVWEYCAPDVRLAFDVVALKVGIRDTLPWAGAIFGAVYALLYSKFASQWTYLASLYNQIKAMEVSAACAPTSAQALAVIVSAKAGFIEDADELHLAPKSMYAAIIRVWAAEEAVKKEFETYAPGGRVRLEDIVQAVNLTFTADEARYAGLHRRLEKQSRHGP